MTVASLAVLNFYRVFTAFVIIIRIPLLKFMLLSIFMNISSRCDTFLTGELAPTDNSACTPQTDVSIFWYEANGLSCGWKIETLLLR